ncbi:hypothetical protein [Nocardiopsis kunsanensis]|uniref:hypothetical protein n=1 Tax=Nocardiopsis kunsanensis TaxID=141693 RepID=UPI001268701E|nr:hypothetical protein [Nocardiopsis kunsanensis]
MKNKRAATAITCALAMLPLALTANASASPQYKELESLGIGEGISEEADGLKVEANSAERNGNGNLVSVTWSVQNFTDDYVTLTWLHDRSYTYSGSYFSAVTATDEDSGTLHHPVMDGNNECLCSGNTSRYFNRDVHPDGQLTYWSLFSTPSDVETLTLEVPGFEPIEDIPID